MNFDWTQLEYILRVLLAGICGIILGAERRNRSKEAGLRTHFLVACGAALIMVISKYAFYDVVQAGLLQGADVRLDPSRVASTIASGIGFLGAGMIFVHKNTISGLTTAAGIWVTSGIGMAIGAGMYVIGVTSTMLVLLAQLLLHKKKSHGKNERLKSLSVKNVTEARYQKKMVAELVKLNIAVQEVSVERLDSDGNRNYVFVIDLPDEIDEEDIINMIPYNASIKPCL